MISLTDEMAIRQVLPRNGPKRLARLMAIPVETARSYYYRHLSASRRRVVALLLLEIMDEEDRSRMALRRHLASMACGDDAVGGDRVGLVDAAADAIDATARALVKWGGK